MALIRPGKGDEISSYLLTSSVEDPTEFPGTLEPVRLGKCLRHDPLLGTFDQGVSRLRPLARRFLMTRRPPLVAMRARKPWRRLRRMRLGWNVRFMMLPRFDPVGGTKERQKNRRKYDPEGSLSIHGLVGRSVS